VPVSTLPPEQLSALRRLLVEQLTALYRTVHAGLRDELLSDLTEPDQRDPGDEADGSQHTEREDLRLRLAEEDARRAQQIEAALLRIRDGSYGICVDCGRPIEFERLRAVPWAERCIDDQEELERGTRAHAPTL
jgi:RNA polymerase-binding protein DksA